MSLVSKLPIFRFGFSHHLLNVTVVKNSGPGNDSCSLCKPAPLAHHLCPHGIQQVGDICRYGRPGVRYKHYLRKKRLDRVYEAKINLYGHPLTNAVAKLADCNMLWERLKIEYDTCTALAKQGVKGIVSILGLYHNVEAGIMVLLMEDGGTPLTRNEEKSIEKLG